MRTGTPIRAVPFLERGRFRGAPQLAGELNNPAPKSGPPDLLEMAERSGSFRRAGQSGDNGIAHGFVGNRDQMAIGGADPSAAQPDGFDYPVDLIELNTISHQKRFVGEDSHRAK